MRARRSCFRKSSAPTRSCVWSSHRQHRCVTLCKALQAVHCMACSLLACAYKATTSRNAPGDAVSSTKLLAAIDANGPSRTCWKMRPAALIEQLNVDHLTSQATIERRPLRNQERRFYCRELFASAVSASQWSLAVKLVYAAVPAKGKFQPSSNPRTGTIEVWITRLAGDAPAERGFPSKAIGPAA
jgi:hypothetical protein